VTGKTAVERNLAPERQGCNSGKPSTRENDRSSLDPLSGERRLCFDDSNQRIGNVSQFPRRIDTVERRKPYRQYCAERRADMVNMYCAGYLIKSIAQRFKTHPANVSYAINRFMRERQLKTHAQLGVWMAQNQAAQQ
jgi:hypothetical protein